MKASPGAFLNARSLWSQTPGMWDELQVPLRKEHSNVAGFWDSPERKSPVNAQNQQMVNRSLHKGNFKNREKPYKSVKNR